MPEQSIDARDLCVGSYVQDALGKSYEVSMFSSSGICDLEARSLDTKPRSCRLFDFTELHPIPITPEWLERLGAKKWRAWTVVAESKGSRFHVAQDFTGGWGLRQDTGWIATVNSIHHLQALVWHLARVWLTVDRKEVVNG